MGKLIFSFLKFTLRLMLIVKNSTTLTKPSNRTTMTRTSISSVNPADRPNYCPSRRKSLREAQQRPDKSSARRKFTSGNASFERS